MTPQITLTRATTTKAMWCEIYRTARISRNAPQWPYFWADIDGAIWSISGDYGTKAELRFTQPGAKRAILLITAAEQREMFAEFGSDLSRERTYEALSALSPKLHRALKPVLVAIRRARKEAKKARRAARSSRP